MKPLLAELLREAPVITDGGWGTSLSALGLEPGSSTDAWNLSHPERVEQVARSYVEAGSKIILTNTFGANRYILDKHGLGSDVRKINIAGVEISRRAAGTQSKVFASVGPSGKMLFMGDVTGDGLAAAFREQITAIAEAQPDGIVLETFTDLDELSIAMHEALVTGLPVAVCMVFGSGKEKDRTIMGVSVQQAVERLTAEGADILGANCGSGIREYMAVFRKMKTLTSLPIWIKPNAGLPDMLEGRPIYRTEPKEFAEYAKVFINEGVDFLGGCCGTTPEFIRELGMLRAPVPTD
jgi:5-methyltetrahydrofolate--homocysteine methyltransferase